MDRQLLAVTIWILVLFGALLVISHRSIADSDQLPAWIQTPPVNGGTYKYYVGRGWDPRSQGEAQNLAMRDAQDTAIRENFGVVTQIEVDNYRNLKETTLNQRINEVSQRVRLVEFERRNVHYRASNQGGFDCWVLYRYPIKEILKEKQRLAKAEPLPVDQSTIVGKSNMKHNTSLVITTQPDGAEVFIDDKRWGVTPINLKGVLEPGVHQIYLTHPEWNDVKQKAVLVNGKTQQISRILEPAKAKLSVTSNFIKARVTLNGKFVGLSTVDKITVLAGRTHTVMVEHPEGETVVREVNLIKDQDRTINVDLPRRMAHIVLGSNVEGSQLYVNQVFNSYVGPKPSQIEVIPGADIEITLERAGYKPYVRTVNLKPGQVHSIGQIDLLPVPSDYVPARSSASEEEDSKSVSLEPLSSSSYDEDWFPDPDWYQTSFSLGFYVANTTKTVDADWAMSTLSVGVSVEQRFWYRFGLRLMVGLDSGGGTDNSVEGGSRAIGIPFYWFDSPMYPYLMYEVGSVDHVYESYLETLAEVRQKRSGWTFGYLVQPMGVNISFSVLEYEMGRGQTHSATSLQLGWVISSGQ
ncbi:MAG: PEGA domain-containing protein [Bdellovibrionales bacterium]|nr:PEGA domain-containing protein [Bdellovibrionales bacterium]